MALQPARSLPSLSPAVKADTPERYQIVRLDAFMLMRAKRAETALKHKGIQPSKFIIVCAQTAENPTEGGLWGFW